MTLPYATFDDYARMMKINDAQAKIDAERIVTDYLRRVTRYIDGVTLRSFYPTFQTRLFSVPMRYMDLRNRLFPFEDLMLDQDLIEPVSVWGGIGQKIDTFQNVLTTMNAADTSMTVSDSDATDGNGDRYYTANSFIRIDDEIIRIVSINDATNTLFIERGVAQTLAAPHDAGEDIYRLSGTSLTMGSSFFLLDFNTLPYYGLRLSYPYSWLGSSFGSFARYATPQIYVTGFWGYHTRTTDAWTNTETLSAALSASASSFTSSDADAADIFGVPRYTKGNMLRIGNELLIISSVNVTTNVVTVLRGQHGSSASAHNAGAQVRRWNVYDEIVEACLATAKTWRFADDSVGGRQGVSEASTGVEISIPKDQMEILQRLRRLS